MIDMHRQIERDKERQIDRQIDVDEELRIMTTGSWRFLQFFLKLR